VGRVRGPIKARGNGVGGGDYRLGRGMEGMGGMETLRALRGSWGKARTGQRHFVSGEGVIKTRRHDGNGGGVRVMGEV